MQQIISVNTSGRSQLLDITAEVEQALRRLQARDGICHLFVPHTTAGITINENADPSVRRDIVAYLDRLVPWQGDYAHSEGNAAAHIKASLLGSSVTVPVQDGRLVLGTWQGIYLAEFDGPRRRQVVVTFSAE
ncbi:MAG: secondary thiamine-phosphate synthase enzyme YjbQ [Anaerolineae bacterium]